MLFAVINSISASSPGCTPFGRMADWLNAIEFGIRNWCTKDVVIYAKTCIAYMPNRKYMHIYKCSY